MAWTDIFGLSGTVALFIYHRWIEDEPSEPLTPAAVLPRTEEGAPIAMVYGTTRIRTPVLVWSGNYLVPGQVYVPLGPNPGPNPNTADHHSVDVLFLLGVPFYGGKATMLNLLIGDVSDLVGAGVAASAGTTQQFEFGPRPPTTSDLSINGVFYRGGSNQDATNGTPSTVIIGATTFDDGVSYNFLTGYDSCLAQNADDVTLVPGYRNQILAFMHIGIGLTPSIPSFGFEVTSLSTSTASDLGNSLALDADPAAVIYDLLTSPWGKIGLSTSLIDLPSFQAASLTLFNEGHGYSRAIDQSTDGISIIQDILKQIDAALDTEPTTGLITLKLIRNDYDPNALDDVNPDNAKPAGSGWYTIQGWAELPNQIRLSFTDRLNGYQPGIAIGQNSANAIAQSRPVRSVSVSYPSVCDRGTATKLASRELGAVSRPIVKASVEVSRAFYAKRPGDVVTFTWPKYGISKMVMRIAAVNRGQPHAQTIKLDMIRDVFDVSIGAYPIP